MFFFLQQIKILLSSSTSPLNFLFSCSFTFLFLHPLTSAYKSSFYIFPTSSFSSSFFIPHALYYSSFSLSLFISFSFSSSFSSYFFTISPSSSSSHSYLFFFHLFSLFSSFSPLFSSFFFYCSSFFFPNYFLLLHPFCYLLSLYSSPLFNLQFL